MKEYNNGKIKLAFLPIVILILFTIVVFLGVYSQKQWTPTVYANDSQNVETCACNVQSDYEWACMSDERDYIKDIKNLEIPFTVKSKSTIENYSYEGNISVLCI